TSKVVETSKIAPVLVLACDGHRGRRRLSGRVRAWRSNSSSTVSSAQPRPRRAADWLSVGARHRERPIILVPDAVASATILQARTSARAASYRRPGAAFSRPVRYDGDRRLKRRHGVFSLRSSSDGQSIGVWKQRRDRSRLLGNGQLPGG